MVLETEPTELLDEFLVLEAWPAETVACKFLVIETEPVELLDEFLVMVI